ncbi:hypothetical protein AB0M45_20390 [Nocardia sp. NPDC051787]|uniref:hypothetical protein n=1 Tax=Nocardia sp. NPDC051787 TaxID=3155415 RepID=UPI003423E46C
MVDRGVVFGEHLRLHEPACIHPHRLETTGDALDFAELHEAPPPGLLEAEHRLRSRGRRPATACALAA